MFHKTMINFHGGKNRVMLIGDSLLHKRRAISCMWGQYKAVLTSMEVNFSKR